MHDESLPSPVQMAPLLEDASNSSPTTCPCPIETLSDDQLVHVFTYLQEDFDFFIAQPNVDSFIWFRCTLPLVCRRWRQALRQGGSAWRTIHINVGEEVKPCARQGKQPQKEANPVAVPSLTTTSRRYNKAFVPKAFLHCERVMQWLKPRLSCSTTQTQKTPVQHLMLNFLECDHHDFGTRSFEALLRMVKPGLRSLHVEESPGISASEHDALDCLVMLRNLEHLHLVGISEGFMSSTLPTLTALTRLRVLHYVPICIGYSPPVKIAALPPYLEELHLSALQLDQLPTQQAPRPSIPSPSRAAHASVPSDDHSSQPLGRTSNPPTSTSTISTSASAPRDIPTPTTLARRSRELSLLGSSPSGSLPGSSPPAPATFMLPPPLSHLRQVRLANCNLSAPAFRALLAAPRLEVLQLLECGMLADAQGATWATVLAGVGEVLGLRHLTLQACYLRSLPAAALAFVPGLTYLDISRNVLSSALEAALPEQVDVLLPQLRVLDLSWCGLTSLPPGITAMQGLATLHVQGNQLASLLPQAPAAAAAPSPGAAVVEAGRQQLPLDRSSLPASPAFHNTLTDLDLSHNRLANLPLWVLSCPALKHLTISQVMLTPGTTRHLVDLPSRTPSLQRLTVLGKSFEAHVVRCMLALSRRAMELGSALTIDIQDQEEGTIWSR
mmetsp:Transcript_4214/g.9179  ORF Transcript_4214/g.9179 Transcript_4214/m.9179 type:complete len:669 (-) Transcript_4214:791-2797(-)